MKQTIAYQQHNNCYDSVTRIWILFLSNLIRNIDLQKTCYAKRGKQAFDSATDLILNNFFCKSPKYSSFPLKSLNIKVCSKTAEERKILNVIRTFMIDLREFKELYYLKMDDNFNLSICVSTKLRIDKGERFPQLKGYLIHLKENKTMEHPSSIVALQRMNSMTGFLSLVNHYCKNECCFTGPVIMKQTFGVHKQQIILYMKNYSVGTLNFETDDEVFVNYAGECLRDDSNKRRLALPFVCNCSFHENEEDVDNLDGDYVE